MSDEIVAIHFGCNGSDQLPLLNVNGRFHLRDLKNWIHFLLVQRCNSPVETGEYSKCRGDNRVMTPSGSSPATRRGKERRPSCYSFNVHSLVMVLLLPLSGAVDDRSGHFDCFFWLFSSIESLLHWPRGTEAAGEDSCVTRAHCWTFK